MEQEHLIIMKLDENDLSVGRLDIVEVLLEQPNIKSLQQL
jgi:hypothetical protein